MVKDLGAGVNRDSDAVLAVWVGGRTSDIVVASSFHLQKLLAWFKNGWEWLNIGKNNW